MLYSPPPVHPGTPSGPLARASLRSPSLLCSIETIATIVHENGLPDRVKHLALEIFERSCQRLLKQGHIKKLDMLQDVLVATSLASKWINSSKNLKCAVQVRLLQLHSHHRASKVHQLRRHFEPVHTPFSAPCRDARAAYRALLSARADRVLTGACIPMSCPIHVSGYGARARAADVRDARLLNPTVHPLHD